MAPKLQNSSFKFFRFYFATNFTFLNNLNRFNKNCTKNSSKFKFIKAVKIIQEKKLERVKIKYLKNSLHLIIFVILKFTSLSRKLPQNSSTLMLCHRELARVNKPHNF